MKKILMNFVLPYRLEIQVLAPFSQYLHEVKKQLDFSKQKMSILSHRKLQEITSKSSCLSLPCTPTSANNHTTDVTHISVIYIKEHWKFCGNSKHAMILIDIRKLSIIYKKCMSSQKYWDNFFSKMICHIFQIWYGVSAEGHYVCVNYSRENWSNLNIWLYAFLYSNS